MIVSAITLFSAFKMAAVVTDMHSELPITGDIPNPCSGESVTLNGIISQDFHTVINGNRVNMNIQQKGHVAGVGTENHYNFNFASHATVNLSLINGEGTQVLTINEEYVSQGSSPNFIVREKFKVTVTANGDVTVSRDGVTTECKG